MEINAPQEHVPFISCDLAEMQIQKSLFIRVSNGPQTLRETDRMATLHSALQQILGAMQELDIVIEPAKGADSGPVLLWRSGHRNLLA